MAKEKHKDDDRPTSEASYDGGGINAGVAVVGFILCFLAGAGLMWGYDAHRLRTGDDATADNAAAWSDEDSPIPVSSKDPYRGNRDAPVTIVQFSDFQCPFCSRIEPTMDQIKQAYGDKVRFIWKNKPLPFHPNAKPAAEAAMGAFALAGNDGFWKFHDLAFKNQQQLSRESYESWAQQAGVKDMAAFKAGLDSHKWAERVEKDDAVAGQVGVSGTPAAFVNGVLVSGAQPFEKFKAVIDQELEKAQAKIASGTPKNKIYVTMSQENKKNAPAAAKPEEEQKEDTTTVFKVPVGTSAVQGNPSALVTIIEFSDFQCPYCKRVEPTLKALRDKYGDKLRIVWKNEPLPFHPRAEPAAEVALEGRAEKGDKGFWDVHDKLFDSQPKLDDPDLDAVAQAAGLNMDKVHDAMKNHKYKSVLDTDADLGDDMQASGTPHFFVNGRRLVGAQPQEKFEKIIDEEIPKAQALLAKGIAPKALYDELIKDGKGAPEPEKKTVPLSPNAPARGNMNSKIVIQEFSDFQCPYCKRAEDSVTEVMKNYGDKVKFVWRNLPLPMHPDAPLAAQAAMEAYKQKGNDGFWKMHDLLYQNQPDQKNQNGLKREALDTYAQQLGLNMDKWKTALDNQTHKAEVDADAKAGNDAGISGTPAFVINGYFINGAQPYAKFRKIIERAMAEAK